MALRPVSSNTSNRVDSERYAFEDAGDILEGHLVESVRLSKDGNSFMKYTLKTNTGHVSTLGSHQLDTALAKVSPGTLVRITYNGKKKIKGGKTVKEFLVEADDENRIQPVSAAEAVAQARVS